MSSESIHGYSDRISVSSGQRIRFMVSAEGGTSYRADIVRLIRGDTNPKGPGPKEELIETSISNEYPARCQPIYAGSHILIEDPARLLNVDVAITLHAFIMPTTAGKGPQGILARWDPELDDRFGFHDSSIFWM